MKVNALVITSWPGADAQRAQNEVQRVGAVGHRHAVLGAAVVRDLPLQGAHLRSQNELGRLQHRQQGTG